MILLELCLKSHQHAVHGGDAFAGQVDQHSVLFQIFWIVVRELVADIAQVLPGSQQHPRGFGNAENGWAHFARWVVKQDINFLLTQFEMQLG